MRIKQLFLTLALLCAIVQGAWAQASWDEVYAMTNTITSDWAQLSGGSTTGRTLGAAGTTTYYYANSDLTFTNSTAGGSGLTILGTVYLYVPQGVTVTCTGANANGTTGAGAGIELTEGNTLHLLGSGTLNATGGNAANGGNGGAGGDAGWDSNYWSGTGGTGGNGGGGAGAGIGTRGGNGGQGGAGAASVTTEWKAAGGGSGIAGHAGTTAAAMGSFYRLQSLVNLSAKGGTAGTSGSAGSAGKSAFYDGTGYNYTAAGGGGGGAGGFGGAAANIGTGGPGGGGGGGGASGNLDWSTEPGYYVVKAPGGKGGQNRDGTWAATGAESIMNHNAIKSGQVKINATGWEDDAYNYDSYISSETVGTGGAGGNCGGNSVAGLTTFMVYSDATAPTRINISGPAVLNLGDGATLHAPKGIEVSRGNRLTINGSGALVIDGCDDHKSGIGAEFVGEITINGGTIDVKGGSRAAGIGGDYKNRSGGTITINGGVVKARGGSMSAGIGGGMGRSDLADYEGYGVCGDITISGGQVSAYGDGGAGIGPGFMFEGYHNGRLKLGWTNLEDFIYSTGYTSGHPEIHLSSFSFIEGKQFLIDGTTTIATTDNIAGKKIVPYIEGEATLSGAGTQANPWRITSTADWNALAQNVVNGYNYSGQFVQLDADIEIARGVGIYDENAENARPFSGTFLGGGHTITADLTTYNSSLAPFIYIDGATIKNLTIAGTVTTNIRHSSGLVAFAGGTNLIEDCIVTATIRTSSDYTGGFIGHGQSSTTTIKDCIFAGAVSGVDGNRPNVGVFWGWSDSATPTLVNCLEKGTYTNISSMHPMGLQAGSGTITNCYYITPQIGSPANACTVSGGYRVFTNPPSNEMYYSISAADANTYYVLCDISGIAESYSLSEGVSITPTVTGVESMPLELGSDYTATLNGKAVDKFPVTISTEGEYTLVLAGHGAYADSNTFKIVVFGSQLAGEGTADSPYLIGSNMDWCLFANDVNSGAKNYYGKQVKLTADISTSTMVGVSEAHSFQGAFLGDGHTLTFTKGSSAKPFAEEYCAPFRHIKDATIRDLKVTGDIYTSKKYAAGLVACPYGELLKEVINYIINCRVSTVIHSSIFGEASHGGIAALACRELHITGCVYDGRLFTTSGTTSCGGLIGRGFPTGYDFPHVSNSLYAPNTNIAAAAGESLINDGGTLVRDFVTGRIVNCFYIATLGSAQGMRVRPITAGANVIVACSETAKGAYNVSGLTVYDKCFEYDGVFYGAIGQDISLMLSGYRNGYIPAGFQTSAGKLTRSGNRYTLNMPDNDVTISATSWMKGLQADDDGNLLINNADDWATFCNLVALGYTFSDQTVKLTADISVSEMVGVSETYSFQGTFLGDGIHTLTFTKGTAESAFGEENCAPFRYIKNATIRNLKVAGDIYTSRKFAAGLVATCYGTTNIEGCQVGTIIHSSVSGDGTHGGIVAMPASNTTTNISGCVYTGRLLTTNGTTHCGGLMGWSGNNTVTVAHSLYAPNTPLALSEGETAIDHGATFVRGNKPTIGANCYYTETMGSAQGTRACTYDTAPANIGSQVVVYGMVKAYQNGILYDGKYYVAPASITLADNSDNSTAISNADGYGANVTITGCTLYRDGSWNTLCLPFSLEDFAGTPLEGATVKTLASTDFSGGTLTMNFTDDVTSITAGTPYIVKWAEGTDIANPVFDGVAISDVTANVETDYVDFVGTYSPVNIYTDKKTNLYLGAGNTLYYPTATDFTANAFRGYFQLKQGLTAGEPTSAVRAFVLNFGDGERSDNNASGIITTNFTNSTNSDNAWYSLDGRRLNGKPTRAGVYINKGKKVAIK
ncbi:MAG: hypothetical protein IJ887_09185 [Prevotella sp.]|nr:hypothetical protein [Prevotella sp.]